jgi:hypothetical protein
MCKQTLAMAKIKIIGSLFCLRTNRARNRTAICMQIRTRVDGPLAAQPSTTNQMQTLTIRRMHNIVVTCLHCALLFRSMEALLLSSALFLLAMEAVEDDEDEHPIKTLVT